MVNFNFSITVTPSHCNTWPWFQVNCGHTILYDGLIEYKQTLNFNISSEDNSCHISLIGIKKRKDTAVGINGEILKDKTLYVDNITINDINMGDEFIRHLSIKDINGNTALFSNKTFYLDGEVGIDITFPIIDWVIETKFISLLPTYQNSENMFESTFSKFEYNLLHNKINQIKALLNDQNSNL